MAPTSRSNGSDSRETRARAANGRFTSRQRKRSAKTPSEPAGMLTERPNEMPSTESRRSGAEVEQIAILSFALLCGLVGLAVHVLWFVSIVLMAVLLGLTAAAVRRRPATGS